MGKGDKKTKRGKIQQGSYGKKRPRRKDAKYIAPVKPKKKVVKEEKPSDIVEEAPVQPKVKKKVAPKKEALKKETSKKSTTKKVAEKKATDKKPAAAKTVKKVVKEIKKTEEKKEE